MTAQACVFRPHRIVHTFSILFILKDPFLLQFFDSPLTVLFNHFHRLLELIWFLKLLETKKQLFTCASYFSVCCSGHDIGVRKSLNIPTRAHQVWSFHETNSLSTFHTLAQFPETSCWTCFWYTFFDLMYLEIPLPQWKYQIQGSFVSPVFIFLVKIGSQRTRWNPYLSLVLHILITHLPFFPTEPCTNRCGWCNTTTSLTLPLPRWLMSDVADVESDRWWIPYYGCTVLRGWWFATPFTVSRIDLHTHIN